MFIEKKWIQTIIELKVKHLRPYYIDFAFDCSPVSAFVCHSRAYSVSFYAKKVNNLNLITRLEGQIIVFFQHSTLICERQSRKKRIIRLNKIDFFIDTKSYAVVIVIALRIIIANLT